MGTVFLVAGLFISESTPYTVSAYPAIPAITRLHSGTQLYPGAGRKSDQLESRERGHAAVENSEDSGRVLGGSFWPYSQKYLSQQYLSSTGTPVPSLAVNTVVPADSGTADAGTPA